MPGSQPSDTDMITPDAVRFLAWLKKRGGSVRLAVCRKKWEPKNIAIEEICRHHARGRLHVRRDPSSGEKWVVLDDLVWADRLMIAHGEEVPHHRHWTKL